MRACSSTHALVDAKLEGMSTLRIERRSMKSCEHAMLVTSQWGLVFSRSHHDVVTLSEANEIWRAHPQWEESALACRRMRANAEVAPSYTVAEEYPWPATAQSRSYATFCLHVGDPSHHKLTPA